MNKTVLLSVLLLSNSAFAGFDFQKKYPVSWLPHVSEIKQFQESLGSNESAIDYLKNNTKHRSRFWMEYPYFKCNYGTGYTDAEYGQYRTRTHHTKNASLHINGIEFLQLQKYEYKDKNLFKSDEYDIDYRIFAYGYDGETGSSFYVDIMPPDSDSLDQSIKIASAIQMISKCSLWIEGMEIPSYKEPVKKKADRMQKLLAELKEIQEDINNLKEMWESKLISEDQFQELTQGKNKKIEPISMELAPLLKELKKSSTKTG